MLRSEMIIKIALQITISDSERLFLDCMNQMNSVDVCLCEKYIALKNNHFEQFSESYQ